jgi:integrase
MKPIAGFLENFKGPTLFGYRSAIFQFLDYKFGYARRGKDSTPQEREQYEEMAKKYLQGEIALLRDLKGFKDHMFEQKRPPHSISQNMACIRVWLEHYDHSLTSKELRDLKKYLPKQRSGVTREDEVTPETIKLILAHSNPKVRAMVLLLLSSGIRIGELVKLTLDDINFERNTLYISDLISKTGESRITFFTDEAKEAIEYYLKDREKGIDRAEQRATRIGKKYTRRDGLFPFTTDNMRGIFNTALKNAGLKKTDQRTGRNTIHPHAFRKCFISWLKLAGCPEDIVEGLAGHQGYLSVAYRRYSESQLRTQYQKYSHSLTIGDYGYERRKQLEERVGGQADRILALERELATLKGFMEVVAENPDLMKSAIGGVGKKK